MPKKVWVSRRVANYRVGAWLPAWPFKLAALLFFVFAIWGLFLAKDNADHEEENNAKGKQWIKCFYDHHRDGSSCGPGRPAWF
jgi:hypothetical protein